MTVWGMVGNGCSKTPVYSKKSIFLIESVLMSFFQITQGSFWRVADLRPLMPDAKKRRDISYSF